jgi:hypothetical protein
MVSAGLDGNIFVWDLLSEESQKMYVFILLIENLHIAMESHKLFIETLSSTINPSMSSCHWVRMDSLNYGMLIHYFV